MKKTVVLFISLIASLSFASSVSGTIQPFIDTSKEINRKTAPEKLLPTGRRQYVGTSSNLNQTPWPFGVLVNHPAYERFLADDAEKPTTANPGFGGAFFARNSHVVVHGSQALLLRPLTVRLRVKSSAKVSFNIFASFEPKSSAAHWELYSFAGDGTLAFYMPGNQPETIRTSVCVTDDRWHDVAAVMTTDRVLLYVDGVQAADAPITRPVQPFPDGGRIGVGSLVEGRHACDGWLDEFCLRISDDIISAPLSVPQRVDDSVIMLCAFEPDPVLPFGTYTVSGQLAGKLTVEKSVADFIEELLPRSGIESVAALGDKPPKNIPFASCTPEQLAATVQRLGIQSVRTEEQRLGLLTFWGEQVVELQNQIDGKMPLPRGAATQVYDENALIRANEKTPYAVVVRRTDALMTLLENHPSPSATLAMLRQDLTRLKLNVSPQPHDVFAACALRRAVMLVNPDLAAYDKLAFLARATYAGCRLTNMGNSDRTGGHFATQCFGFNTIRGGGIFALEGWRSKNPSVKNLLAGCVVSNGPLKGKPLDSGSFYTPDVSYDGKTVYFAHCGATEHRWEWAENTTWKIFKLELENGRITQLTEGPWNDFDPVELPSGRLAFISERRGGFIRCFTEGSRLRVPTFVLHSMKADGSDIYPLSYYETSEWQPSVDNNGMLLYTRWDYTDREDCLGSQFWNCFPDGRDPRAPHGNYPLPWHTFADNTHGDHRFNRTADAPSGLPMTEMHIRAIPDSHRYILTAAPHHGETFGSLCVLDLRLPDDYHMSQLRRVTPYVPFPESESAGRSQYQYGTAWPVSEDVFICNRWEDLVVLDRFGNEELICERELLPTGYDARLRLTHPKPLRARPKPPIIPQQTAQGTDFAKADKQATIGVMNVNITDQPFPAGRTPKRLRVLQAVLKSDPWMDKPYIGYGQENTPRIPLGTVALEADGSAYFEAPAGKQLIFQVLDENNMAIQTMRSTAFVHPGERLTCLGCHESKHGCYAVKKEQPRAFQRAPSKLEPECGPIEPVNFYRLVAPILNNRCLTCHQKEKKGPQKMGYKELRDYAFHFGGGFGGNTMQKVYGGSRSIPGRCGVAASRIGKALLTSKHQKAVPEDERHRVILWLDANALQYSSYHDTAAQKRGELVWPLLDVDPAHPLANSD